MILTAKIHKFGNIATFFPKNTESDKPMGVATYKTTTDMPKELRHTLPDIEELKKLV